MLRAAFATAVGCAGGLVGWFVVPWLADLLLKRAYRRSHAWWLDSLASYREFKRAHPQREPSPWAAGEEGVVGMWKVQAVRAVRAGSLPRERVHALIEAGCEVNEEATVRSEAEQKERCAFRAGWRQRLVSAAGCALTGFGIGWCSDTEVGVALAVTGGAMAVAIACDVKARIIPFETCATIALAGAAFQVSVGGFGGLLVGSAYAAIIVTACIAANRLFGRTGGAPVGYGDVRCMGALSLMCGAAVPVGIVFCYGSAAAFSLAGIVTGKLSCKSGIPMAPFLALWLVGGAWAGMQGLM